MNVVGDTSDSVAIAFGRTGNRRQIGVHRPDCIVREEAGTVLCREDDVGQDVRQRLNSRPLGFTQGSYESAPSALPF